MCYNGVRAHDLKFEENLKECQCQEMTKEKEEKFYKLINICLDHGAKFFTITGGEPMLYPDLVCNLITKIKEKGGYASINTNSTLINEDVAIKFKEAGLNSALTSIHGSTEEVHKKIVCTPGAYKRALTGISNLLSQGIHVVPNFVASHENVNNMYETARMLYGLGIKRQAYSIFIPTPNVEHHKKLTMTKEDYQTYFKTLEHINSEFPDLSATATLPVPPCLARGLVEPTVLEKFEHRTCPSGRQFMVVNIEGNVSPCIQRPFDKKYGENIETSSLNIVDSMKDWKKLLNTPEKCIDCAAKSYCNPCNMNILVNNDKLGPLSTPYPDFAPINKDEMNELSKKYSINIPTDKNDLNKVYKLHNNIIIRKENDGYITIINPSIQGYTVLSNIDPNNLKENFKINNKQIYKLLKAMNALEEVNNSDNYIIITGGTIPKYKILTEFIGKDFNDDNLVYCLRTDTAGRFFCVANTEKEKEEYEKAEKVYRKYMLKG
jgi:radical SAM protein with 4Fe4S-binding SPASM domain